MNKEDFNYFCIFGGGAIRGITYAGAVRALKEKKINITGYAGSSAGSIAAVMTALGYSENELEDIFSKFDYMLFRDINLSFKIELAISKGEVFTDKIREIIARKLKTDKPVTFKDFPKNIYILTSNLTTGESVVFSKETTPDFEVAKAIRISASFPGLMNPYEIDGEYYVDGDLAKPFALSQLSKLLNPKDTRILEFRLEGGKVENLPTNPIILMNNSIDFVTRCATKNVIEYFGNNDKYDFITIETENTLLFDLNISKEQKTQLIKLGYNKTIEYFENVLPKKKQKSLNEYQKLKKVLNNTFQNLLSRDYIKAKNCLNKYICENYKNLELIDENLVNSTQEICKMLNSGITKNILFLPVLNNHIEVKIKTKELIEQVENKINSIHYFLENIKN